MTEPIVFLNSLAIANYRGIGGIQQLSGLKTINLFVGTNNSGKSAFLAFIAEQLETPARAGSPTRKRSLLQGLDIHVGKHASEVEYCLGVAQARLQDALMQWADKRPFENKLEDCRIVAEWLTGGEEDIWFAFAGGTGKYKHMQSPDEDSDSPKIKKAVISIYNATQPGTTLVNYAHAVQQVRNLAQSLLEEISLPECEFIPAIRQMGAAGEPYVDRSGKGLIDQLAAIQQPNLNERQNRLLFDEINQLLRSVTEDDDATLEITHDRKEVLVRMRGKLLPLSSLGTGIHELVMLGSFCTLAQNKIVCIEEPEIHLHPSLQRKLMQYLALKTKNQYFIATHSPVLIDTPNARVFHVENKEGETVITSSSTPSQRYAICADLGCRASDIVQANSIVWVEGPSDRVYLKHWLQEIARDLIEGVHFSIMFYGGRLLSHLSAPEDEGVQDFINLRQLNRNLAIIIDSDRDKAGGKLNPTKRRIEQELSLDRGFVWITKGREVENYIPTSLLHQAVAATHANVGEFLATGQYSHALTYRRLAGKATKNQSDIVERVDKVKVAKYVATKPVVVDILDLKRRLNQLAAMIYRANGMKH